MDIEDIKHYFQVDGMYKMRAEQHFFEAMKAGYVGGGEKGTMSELPRSKTLDYVWENWRVLDVYITSPISDYSGGTTTVYFDNVPIWMMQYLGWYKEEGIICLKAALQANYEEGIYYGGRGPQSFLCVDGSLYSNLVQQSNFHGRTAGQETVFAPDGNVLGQHLYQAMWLIDK